MLASCYATTSVDVLLEQETVRGDAEGYRGSGNRADITHSPTHSQHRCVDIGDDPRRGCQYSIPVGQTHRSQYTIVHVYREVLYV